MAEAALDYDQLLDQPPLEIPPGGIANFLTATSGSWADDEDIPRSGIAEVKKVADKLAEYGRHEDEYMVHAAEGETVVPMAVLEKNPKLKEKLFEQMRMMGIDPERYVVGNELNSINPVTGQPEFFLRKAWRGIKNVFKKVVHVVLPAVLNTVFPGMGAMASTALSSGIITLTQGGSFGDALKSAAIGGAVGGLYKGVTGGIEGLRTGEGFGAGFREGVAGSLPARMQQRMYQRQLQAQGKDVSEYFPEAKDIPVEKGVASKTTAPAERLPGAPDPKQVPSFDSLPVDRGAGYIVETLPGGSKTITEKNMFIAQQRYKGEPVVFNRGDGAVEQIFPDGRKTTTYSRGLYEQAQQPQSQPTVPSQPEPPQPVPSSSAPAGVESLRPRRFGEAFADIFKPGGKGVFESAREAFFPGVPSYDKISQAMFGKPFSALNSTEIAKLKLQAADLKPGMMRQYAPLLGASMVLGKLNEPDEIEVDMSGGPFGQTGFDLMRANPGKYTVNFNLPTYDRAMGGSIDSMDFPPRIGAIYGPGTETSDDVPAMLSDGEFVMTAEAVRGSGNGSREAGMNTMYNLMRNFERVA